MPVYCHASEESLHELQHFIIRLSLAQCTTRSLHDPGDLIARDTPFCQTLSQSQAINQSENTVAHLKGIAVIVSRGRSAGCGQESGDLSRVLWVVRGFELDDWAEGDAAGFAVWQS